MNVDLDRPPVDRPLLDPAVWERTETRRALAARDLAAVFRLLRKAGTSQRTIAALTGLAPSEVYEIGRGRRVMAYDVLCRIADGLGVPRGYLGLAYDSETAAFVSATSPDAAQREQDLDEVGALLAHAAEVAVGMQGGPAALRWAAPREAGTPIPQRVGARDLEQLEAITVALRGLDHGHGGGACREAVVAQTRWVHQLLHADAAEDVRHRLLLASARPRQPRRLDLVRRRPVRLRPRLPCPRPHPGPPRRRRLAGRERALPRGSAAPAPDA